MATGTLGATTMTPEAYVAKMFPKSVFVASALAAALTETFARFDISNDSRKAGFLSQAHHETIGMSKIEESLNYTTAGRIRDVFRHRLAPWAESLHGGNLDLCRAAIVRKSNELVGKPMALAEFVYGGRFGNRPEGSGDGWKYRGRGLFHLTFADNYADAGNAIGLPLRMFPDQVLTLPACVLTAGWFWHNNGCNKFADKHDVVGLTKVINGGKNGLAERIGLWSRFRGMEIPL